MVSDLQHEDRHRGAGPHRVPVGPATGLVRVTVTSGSRRVDLVLPGAVPVAELLPELARSVGLLDPTTVHGGYRVVTADGRRLAIDTGLILQGVEDGGLLTVTAGVDDVPPRIYDDVVEAMTDVVEQDMRPWQPAAGRRTTVIAAGLLFALGAVALWVQRSSDLAAAAAALVALALTAGAVVLSRVQREPVVAVTLGWFGAVYAVVAGLGLATPDADFFAEPLAAAGAGALSVGVIGALGLGPGRILMFPPAVLGALAVAVGLLVRAVEPEGDLAAHLLVTVLALAVLLGSVFPWLALGSTSTRVEALFSPADITADPDPIDPQQVATDARTAHEILLTITGTVGALIVLISPVAVSLGLAGALLALDACVVVMLRTRQYRTGSEVGVGLGAGILGLVVIAVSALVLHPDWRPTLAVVASAAGAALVAVTLVPSAPSVRRGRAGDVLETVSLVALVPLLVFATGLFDRIVG